VDSIIDPISDSQQQEVLNHTRRLIAAAAEYYSIPLPEIPVHFDLYGTTAGMFTVRGRKSQALLRYNPWIFAKYYDENLYGTVPHEVAHYVVWKLYGNKRGIKPHGAEWQQVMDLFGADKSVTCDFDFTGVPQRKQTRYEYTCQCQVHELSATVHNRIQKRRYQYYCKSCEQPLRKKRVTKKVSSPDASAGSTKQISLF